MQNLVRGTALRPWLCEPSITEVKGVCMPNNGKVQPGDIVHLTPKDAARKARQGSFRPSVAPKAAPVPQNKMAPDHQNKAPAAPLAGGPTGAAPAPLSSDRAPALVARESRQPSRRGGRRNRSASSQ